MEEGQRSGEEHPPRVAPEGDMEVEEGADGSAMEPVEQESDFVQRFKRPPDVAIEDLENEIKETSEKILSSIDTFFLLHAAEVRSSCEEGPGQSALQSAYHNPKLDVTELKQNRTP